MQDLDNTWYTGKIIGFNEERLEHKVLYDDGESERNAVPARSEIGVVAHPFAYDVFAGESEWVALGHHGGGYIRYRIVLPRYKDDEPVRGGGGSRKKKRRR